MWARSNGSGAARGAGSACTSGHASLARRRLAFDCFQLLQNFLPWRRSGSCLGRAYSGSETETEFTRCWAPKAKWGWGNRVCESRRPECRAPCWGPPSHLYPHPCGLCASPGDPSPGDGRIDAGQGLLPLPAPTGRGADGGELTVRQLTGQTQLHQVLSGRGDACPGRQSICGHLPRTGFRRQ